MAVTAQRRLETHDDPALRQRARAVRDSRSDRRSRRESYARFLQYDTPADKRKDEGLEGVLREIFPIESYDKKLTLEYLALRAGQAALRAGRVPAAAADLRPAVPHLAAAQQGAADRGRSLPGRHADHARRRRVHHQRRRARRRQPAAPQPRCRLRLAKSKRASAGCTAAASSPSAAAGSRSTSPRRTASPSASTRAASSRR